MDKGGDTHSFTFTEQELRALEHIHLWLLMREPVYFIPPRDVFLFNLQGHKEVTISYIF
jgi:cytochrome c oxidase assembly protein Cox11